MSPVILASSSRYRSELLTRLQIDFETRSPDVDESPAADETPERLVVRLAELKAATVAASYREGLVIGSDQVAVCGAQILGKPGTAERACAQLTLLSGQSVDFLTGLCLLDAASGALQSAVITTTVRFRKLQPDEIRDYVRREQPLDCAGAFKSEGLGIALFEAIEGTDPTALVGLPLIELCRMLARAGRPVVGGSGAG
ncbi:MAG: Maf family protein [Pseudomonadales bacterium]